jgi:hypothetical protein
VPLHSSPMPVLLLKWPLLKNHVLKHSVLITFNVYISFTMKQHRLAINVAAHACHYDHLVAFFGWEAHCSSRERETEREREKRKDIQIGCNRAKWMHLSIIILLVLVLNFVTFTLICRVVYLIYTNLLFLTIYMYISYCNCNYFKWVHLLHRHMFVEYYFC